MPAGGLIVAGIGAGIGGAEWIKGAYDKAQARKAALANVRPIYQTPSSENDLAALTYSQAGQGLSDSSRQVYMNGANQGLSSVLNAGLRGGADPNSLGNAYGNYETGISRLALQDNAAKMEHLNNLASLYQRQTANKDKEYQLNQLDPYKDKAAAIKEQFQAAANMQNAGMNTLGSSLMGAAKSVQTPTPNFTRNTGNDIQMAQPMPSAPQLPSIFQNAAPPQSNSIGFTPMYGNVEPGQPQTYNWRNNIFGGSF